MRDAGGRSSYDYCDGLERGSSRRSSVAIAGRSIASVVTDTIRKLPGGNSGVAFADWGPADLGRLGSAAFPAGSTLHYQTVTPLSTAFAYDVATYLETSEQARPALLMDVAARAEAQIVRDAGNASAHDFLAYGIGRHGQGVSIAKALAQGLGGRVRSALEAAIRLRPAHADAHAALGSFHAEAIDQVGALLGRAQGASRDAGVALFKTALRLDPTSAITRVAFANGLAMLEGEPRMHDATRLYEEAAASEPLDAMERLGVEMAKAALAG